MWVNDRIHLPVTYAKTIPALATVRAYLTQHGYTQGIPIRKGETIVWETWQRTPVQVSRPMGNEHYIELPVLSDARDFPQRMHEFLQELARLEGYNQTGPLYDAIVKTSFPVGVIGP